MEIWVELTDTRMDDKVHHFPDTDVIEIERLPMPFTITDVRHRFELLCPVRDRLVGTGRYRWRGDELLEVFVPENKLAYWYAEFG